MIACFDVHYFDNYANAAAVLFNDWAAADAVGKFTTECDAINEYVAGNFYRRELAPLVQLIEKIDCHIDTFVIDAYCHLSEDRAPGLGQHLYEQLPADSIVIGVAKNRFRDTKHAVELFRGNSKRPLFVSAAGMDYFTAGNLVKQMHGKNRIPTLLKLVDRLARNER